MNAGPNRSLLKPLDRGEQLRLLRSLHVPNVLVEGAKVSGVSSKAVLRTIDDHGTECWASADTIGREACLSEKTVRRAIKALEGLGLISIDNRPGRSSLYRIQWQLFRSTSVTVTDVLGQTGAVTVTEVKHETPVTLTTTPVILSTTPATITDEALEASRKRNSCPEQATGRNKSLRQTKALRGFEEWYSVYPKKKARGGAEKAYTKAIAAIQATEQVTADAAVELLMRWTKERLSSLLEVDHQYRPHPATWLNSKGYLDEIESTVPKPTTVLRQAIPPHVLDRQRREQQRLTRRLETAS